MRDNESTKPKSGWEQRLRTHPVVAGLVIAVAVLSAANGLLDFPQRLRQFRAAISSPAPKFSMQGIDREEVPRFGVSFAYPHGWDRLNAPSNGDGAIFTNPSDTLVTISGYGSFSPSVLGNGTLIDAVNQEIAFIHKKPSGTIIGQSESGTYSTGVDGARSDIDGWRVVYDYLDERSRPMRVMEKLAVDNGREVVILMQAPKNEYSRYKDAFLALVAELRLAPCLDCKSP